MANNDKELPMDEDDLVPAGHKELAMGEDDFEQVPLKTFEQEIAESNSPSMIHKGARALLEGFGGTAREIDKYTGAPIRAGVSAGIKGENPFKAGYNQFGQDAANAPTGKDIAKQLGISDKEFDVGLKMNPWKPDENIKVSPAGLAGGAVEMATDPTMYVTPPGVGYAAKLAGKGAKFGAEVVAPSSKYLARIAEEQAFKAGSGMGAKAFNRAAGKSAENALPNIRKIGRSMLETDEAGKPVVGWLDRPESIAPKAAAKKDFYGDRIGDVSKKVDQKLPGGSVNGKEIADEILEYAASIPDVGQGSSIQNRLMEEAEKISKYGNMSFAEAQKIKNQFKFNSQNPDALFSNADATNKINRLVGGKMEGAAKAGGEEASYLGAKKKYDAMGQMEDAATARTIGNINKNLASPSDKASTGVGFIGSLIAGQDPATSMAIGAATGVGNKVMRERSPAFIAKTFDTISKQIARSPENLGKYAKAFEVAAREGSRATIGLHRMLLNNDPQYVKILQELERKKEQQ